jgi:hypothetical protein
MKSEEMVATMENATATVLEQRDLLCEDWGNA